MNDYITRPELASMLRLSVTTLESPRFRRSGPTYYRIGKAVRYLRSDVADWIAQRRVAA